MITALQQAVAAARKLSARIHPSRKWQPLKHSENYPDHGMMAYPGTTTGHIESWGNDLYELNVRRYSDGWPFGGGEWVYIGIAALDGAARHDWREMQKIKNEVCGPEWEALELFPAESRLLDPSNYYLLFCAPKIPLGRFSPRQLANGQNSIAPQRDWAKGDEPSDCGKFLERGDN